MQSKFEEIASKAQIAACIMGNPETSQFVLLDLAKPLSKDFADELAALQMRFCGIMAIVDSAPQVALAEEMDSADLGAISEAFIQHVSRAIDSHLKANGDEVDFLTRLASLEDPRD